MPWSSLLRLSITPVCVSLTLVLGGCGSSTHSDSPQKSDGSGSPGSPHVDVFDAPLPGLTRDEVDRFDAGDIAFSTPLKQSDGLGPLYTRSSCDSCHAQGVRGPGVVQKMAVVEADGVTPAADQSRLAFGHTVHPLVNVEGAVAILPPEDAKDVKITTRVGPPVIGRGYVEAVADSEIERQSAEQKDRTDGIHGRVNHVKYASELNEDTTFGAYQKGDDVIGRFGLKARIATLDDFTADAFQGDMGITSPLRPDEFKNPSAAEDEKPGVDVSYASVNKRAMYVRLLDIPARRLSDAGAALFEATLCSVCHVPSLRTREDYPVAALAGLDAPIYSDLLLHDMGDTLADGLPAGSDTDGEASSRDWRTTPLIGLRFNRTLLHDGRADSVEQAILGHRGEGSEANVSVDAFERLSSDDRALLLEFVQAL